MNGGYIVLIPGRAAEAPCPFRLCTFYAASHVVSPACGGRMGWLWQERMLQKPEPEHSASPLQDSRLIPCGKTLRDQVTLN